MKKKMMAGMMAAMMTAGMVMTVSAADTSQTATVTYREPNAYTISIPQSVTLTDQGGSSSVGVSQVNLEPDKKIDFKITAGADENGVIELSRENDTNTKAVTTVSATNGGTGIAKDSVFATFTADGTKELFFTAPKAKDGGQIKAGKYEGTITFTVEAPEKN